MLCDIDVTTSYIGNEVDDSRLTCWRRWITEYIRHYQRRNCDDFVMACVCVCVCVDGWLDVSPNPRWRAVTIANIYSRRRRSTSAPICISRECTCVI